MVESVLEVIDVKIAELGDEKCESLRAVYKDKQWYTAPLLAPDALIPLIGGLDGLIDGLVVEVIFTEPPDRWNPVKERFPRAHTVCFNFHNKDRLNEGLSVFARSPTCVTHIKCYEGVDIDDHLSGYAGTLKSLEVGGDVLAGKLVSFSALETLVVRDPPLEDLTGVTSVAQAVPALRCLKFKVSAASAARVAETLPVLVGIPTLSEVEITCDVPIPEYLEAWYTTMAPNTALVFRVLQPVTVESLMSMPTASSIRGLLGTSAHLQLCVPATPAEIRAGTALNGYVHPYRMGAFDRVCRNLARARRCAACVRREAGM